MPKRNKKVEINIKADGKDWKWNEHSGPRHWHKGGAGGIYGLGFIGAAIYYLQTSTGFWQGVLGVLKAIVWPAFVVYKLLGL